MSRRNRNGKSNKEGQSSRNSKAPSERSTNSSRETSSETSTTREEGTKEGAVETNDVEWYDHDPRLTRDSANIPFNLPFGAPIQFFGKDPNVVVPGDHHISANSYRDYAVPGIQSLALKPSYGISTAKTSPLNVAANALYTNVRHVNNGRKNYDPADLMMYALVWGDIYSFVNWNIRLYNYAFQYSQRNWYVGKSLIEANGVNSENLVRNLANYRYWINSMINKVSSFAVPKSIDFFKRRVFLYNNCYIENQYGNIKDQLYQFVPEGFMRFELDSRQAGKLRYTPLPFMEYRIPMTFSDLESYFNTLMANITGDEDFGLMSGDILRAYGLDGIIGLTQIPEVPEFSFVYDPYVLSQMKNSYVCGELYRNVTYLDHNGDTHHFGDLEQTTDGLLIYMDSQDWAHNYADAFVAAMDKPLSVENPDPGVGDIMEATRLMPYLSLYEIDRDTAVWGGGTEIVTELRVNIEPDVGGAHEQMIYNHGLVAAIEKNATDVSLIPLDFSKICAAFKYHPNSYAFDVESDGQGHVICHDIQLITNVDNLTLITNDNLQRIHEVALLSLFYVPGVAKLLS